MKESMQILFIILIIINILIGFYYHGEKKEGYHNVRYTIIGTIIEVLILTFGGFFGPITIIIE